MDIGLKRGEVFCVMCRYIYMTLSKPVSSVVLVAPYFGPKFAPARLGLNVLSNPLAWNLPCWGGRQVVIRLGLRDILSLSTTCDQWQVKTR